ncbi:MAG: LysR family transcriptional regulator [Pseudomonadota bacterium]
MRLTLDALSVLDIIDRKGSFAAAAESLHRVPSAITYTIQKLEQDLGVTLFDREGYRASLTTAGRELLKEGRHLLQAADALEARVKRVATGWEAELRIAVDDLIRFDALLPLLAEFYASESGTRLRLSREVYGGTWDALLTGRADLVIGATGDAPPGGGYQSHPFGRMELVFAIAPHHPLADRPEPLAEEDIRRYRAVAIADSSRTLPPRTSGLLTGQDVLTVADFTAKVAAQRAGLGVGHLPAWIAEQEAAAGHLLIKKTQAGPIPFSLAAAWRSKHQGNALAWFVAKVTASSHAAMLTGKP